MLLRKNKSPLSVAYMCTNLGPSAMKAEQALPLPECIWVPLFQQCQHILQVSLCKKVSSIIWKFTVNCKRYTSINLWKYHQSLTEFDICLQLIIFISLNISTFYSNMVYLVALDFYCGQIGRNYTHINRKGFL